MKVEKKHLNAAGGCQGGALFTLADIAFAAAVNSHGRVTVSVDSTIAIHKSVSSGWLYATAKETLDVEEYRREMAGIYTTSVSEATIDEAPMAYKSLADILEVIEESVEVLEVLKPIYNFKAG